MAISWFIRPRRWNSWFGVRLTMARLAVVWCNQGDGMPPEINIRHRPARAARSIFRLCRGRRARTEGRGARSDRRSPPKPPRPGHAQAGALAGPWAVTTPKMPMKPALGTPKSSSTRTALAIFSAGNQSMLRANVGPSGPASYRHGRSRPCRRRPSACCNRDWSASRSRAWTPTHFATTSARRAWRGYLRR